MTSAIVSDLGKTHLGLSCIVEAMLKEVADERACSHAGVAADNLGIPTGAVEVDFVPLLSVARQSPSYASESRTVRRSSMWSTVDGYGCWSRNLTQLVITRMTSQATADGESESTTS